jgi:curved DNA-binding protein CbpA
MSSIRIKDEDFKPVLYARLGVAPDATDIEIKKAYKRLAFKTHPDRHPDKKDTFVAIGRAYEVLSDARSAYDSELNVRGYTYEDDTPSNQNQRSSHASCDDERAKTASNPFNRTVSVDDYAEFRELYGYNDETVQRYVEAADRVSLGNPKGGDLHTILILSRALLQIGIRRMFLSSKID